MNKVARRQILKSADPTIASITCSLHGLATDENSMFCDKVPLKIAFSVKLAYPRSVS